MEIGLALVFGAAFLVVYWGATVLLEATGPERRKARLQALSAIVGCGFTTGESESIVNHPRRRSIIFWLMVLDNTVVFGLIVVLITAAGPAERPSWFFFTALGGVMALIIAGHLGLFRWNKRCYCRCGQEELREGLASVSRGSPSGRFLRRCSRWGGIERRWQQA